MMIAAHERTRIPRMVSADIEHCEDRSPRTMVRAVKSLFVPTSTVFQCREII